METEPYHATTARSKVPAGFLGMVLLVVLLELYIGRRYPPEVNGNSNDWRVAAELAKRQAAECDLLCFGDSQMKTDVQPRVLEPLLGRPTLNLAVIAGQAPSSYYLFRRALRAGARPSIVVVDYFLPLLTSNTQFNDEQWPEMLSLAETAELSWNAHEARVLGNWVVRKLFPSYHRRTQIRIHVLLNLQGKSPSTLLAGTVYGRNSIANRGGLVRERNTLNHDDLTHVPPCENPGGFTCTPVNQLYIYKFFDLARAHGIRLVWVLLPTTPAWQARIDAADPHQLYEKAMRQMLAQYPNATVVDGRHANYTQQIFWDRTHLDGLGAAAFSTELAAVLQREENEGLKSNRWINLRPYPGEPSGAHLEDIIDSCEIVRADPRNHWR